MVSSEVTPFPEAKSPNAARPGFGWAKLVRVEFGQDLDELLSKGIDGVLVVEIRDVLRQLEFGFIVAVPKGKCRMKEIDPRIFDQTKGLGPQRK